MRRTQNVIIIVLLLFASIAGISQPILHDPLTSRIFNAEKYSDISGSPYLFDEWKKAHVYTPNGAYKNLTVKFDVYDQVLYFEKDGKQYEFTTPFSGFHLFSADMDSSYFTKGYTGSALKETQFVELMVSGKLQMIMSPIVNKVEKNEINRGVINSFKIVKRYYLGTASTQMKLIKLSRSELMPLLMDKKKEIEAYISQNKINFRSESDVQKLLIYYNSI
ncbi:MAG: hypothetical protein ACO1NW_13905 [Chitinophagaceae bacterium]